MPSALQLYISCLCLFLVQLLDRVQIQIQWSKPTLIHPFFNKGFGLFPLCMLVLCFPFFHVFMFGSILVCLDLISCILAMLPTSCFPFGFMLVGLWGFLVCLVVYIPLLWIVWIQPCVRIHLHHVLLASHLPFSSLVSLHVRVSHVSLFMCLRTCLPLPFV